MSGFYRRALTKSNLTEDQYRQLLVSASGEIFRLTAVLDSLPSGILVCDEKHVLVMANKCALRLLPLLQPEGGLLWDLIPDSDIAAFFRDALQNGDRVLDHETDIMIHGQMRLLSVSVHPLVDRRQISGSLVHIEDITEKRSREISLRRAENLASLTTLAAGVAHEIKNPLGAISIHLQLMQKALKTDQDPAAQAQDSVEKEKNISGKNRSLIPATLDKYFGILNEEVERLNRIVVDFLFAVRPMSLELRKENLNGIVCELAEFVKAELEQSGIRITLDLDEKLPPALLDQRYIKQVLLNLVKNAQASMHGGGVLDISTSAGDGSVRLTVRDTGSGIRAEDIGKIFEPYFSTKESGTGLGLTIAYKIVREHRGEITVESREGEGTVFEISLPAYVREQRLISYSAGAGGNPGEV